MKNIDLRKVKYLMFIDTETIGSLYVKESVLPFEIGMKIYDLEEQRVVKEKSYLVRKFFNNKYIMGSTFSAGKYVDYFAKLASDKRYKLYSVNEISKDMESLVDKYGIKIMVAHNGQFDKEVTTRLFEEFGVENPIEKLDLLDTMEISKVITYSKDYAEYCLLHRGYTSESTKESLFITNSGRVRTTAQAIYSYLSENPNFKEAHTGLEDIEIEIAIFEQSLARLGNTLVNLNVAPTWKNFAKVYEEED